MTFDPMGSEFLSDANSIFDHYRETDRVVRHEDVWPAPVVSILRHEDVKAGFRDFETFSSYVPPEAREYELGDAISMAGEDPPVHNRIRGAVNRSFTAPAMNVFEPRVRSIVDECFDDVVDRAELMLDARNLHPDDRRTFQRAQQHAAKAVTDGMTKSALERLHRHTRMIRLERLNFYRPRSQEFSS